MSEPAPPAEMVKITIDGHEHEVSHGESLIKAAQDKGTYIPRFCWHERMKPVGMCRMCLVEVQSPRGPMLVTACTNTVTEGMVVDTQSPTVKRAQEAVLEFLLANHPLDCPVCDKGGECPLQDQAMSHGPAESRFVEIKRHFEKPIPISDLVFLDRERCILCARCTRFSEEISGDPLIEFQERGNSTEVNTFPDHPFSSYFSGNTVQICPVGALTAKPYRFRARPWDLTMVESSGMFDTAHPRVSIHASQNEILRVVGVDNDATNHGWLSDKDRFGFEYLRSEDRLTMPLIRRGDDLVEVSWAEALDAIAGRVGLILDEDGAAAFGVIGGAQGTNEDAYAISRFARQVLGTNNLDCRLDDGLAARFLVGTVDRAVIDDIDSADAIVLWGPDLKEEHPTLYLRVRRAAQELGVKLLVVHPRATGLDDRASLKVSYRPGEGLALLDDIAAGSRPDASAIISSGRVVAIVGQASIADGPGLAESVAAYVRSKADSTRILPLAGRANTFGALDMGLAPDLLPGRVGVGSGAVADLAATWGDIPTTPGRDTAGILEGLEDGEIKCLFLVGADPVNDIPRGGPVEGALGSAEYVVSIDLFVNDSNKRADVLLPALGFAEKEGTVTNLEGRVQKVNALLPGPGQSRADWSILADIAERLGRPMGLSSAEMIAKEIASVAPSYEGVTWDLLEWENRDGVVAPVAGNQPVRHIPVSLPASETPESELKLHIARTLYDDGVRLRHCPSLRGLAPASVVYVSPEDARRIGVEEASRVAVATSHGEGEFTVHIDEGTPAGVVYVPFNQPGAVALGGDPVVRVSTVIA